MTRTAICSLLGLLLATSACGGKPKLTSEDDRAIHSLGVKLGEGLVPLELSPHELEVLKAALTESVSMRAAPLDPKAYTEVTALMARRTEARRAKEAARGPAFLKEAAQEPRAVTLSSGVVYRELVAGTGAAAPESSKVKVRLRGTLADGTVFEDSQAVVLPLGPQIIPCWSEAVAHLKVGGKARVVCPPAAAFGDFGRPPLVAPGTTVAYEVELLDVAP